jgi:hypothetical protein
MKDRRDESYRRYLAYHNYLDGTARLIEGLYPTDDDLVRTMAGLPGWQAIRREARGDLEGAAAALRNAWYTEVMMDQVLGYEGAFPFVVPWSMVHAYFAINRAMWAYFMVSQEVMPTSHGAGLHVIGTMLRGEHSAFPAPWRCTLDGDPSVKTVTLTHAGCGEVTLKNPLAAHADPWQNYGLMLRTTRQRQLKAKIAAWKKHSGSSRIMKAQRADLVAHMMPTTLFDALYRMRRRSNYQDSDSFIFSGVKVETTQALHGALLALVDTTLLVFESLISRATPAGWLESAGEAFVEASGPAAAGRIGARLDALRAAG